MRRINTVILRIAVFFYFCTNVKSGKRIALYSDKDDIRRTSVLNRRVYQHKIVSADLAATYIESNMRLVLGHAASTPTAVLEAMTKEREL